MTQGAPHPDPLVERVAQELRQIESEEIWAAGVGGGDGTPYPEHRTYETGWAVISDVLRDGYREDAVRLVRLIRGQVAEQIRMHADQYAPAGGNQAQLRLRRHLAIAERIAAGPITLAEVAEALAALDPHGILRKVTP